MATLNVVFTRALEGSAQTVAGIPNNATSITTSASSQTSSNAAVNETVCILTVTGGSVWVKFGAAPTAAAGSDWLLTDGSTRDFGHLPAGTKVAVINA